MSRNLILVGPMGAGKSTIGRRLSETLHLKFRDSDHLIEARTGACIPWIFEKEGESGFRCREKAIIRELCGCQNMVIATGGGAVLDPENRRLLVASGMVVYLTVELDEQLERVRRDNNRPLLQAPDPRARLEALNRERDPLYREVAHLVVATHSRHWRRVMRTIQLAWGKYLDNIDHNGILAPTSGFDHHTGNKLKRPKIQ